MNLPLPLSVAIIAKNEERNIKRCLASLGGIASEIILVYNDCTDKTVEIAEGFGAKCFENKWCGYIEQKNFALSKCTKKWILCIDADESLSQDLRKSIQDFIVSVHQHSKVKGASFNRCCFFLGKWIKHGDWYPDRKLGLIQNGKARWVGLNPHAKLSFTDDYRQKFLHGDLEHYSYDKIRLLSVKTLQYSDDFILNNKFKSHSCNFYISVILRPLWRFIRGYFLRLGFLDGAQGFAIALSTAYETLLKHGGLWESRYNNLDKNRLSNISKGNENEWKK